MRRKKLWAAICCLGWSACPADGLDVETQESALSTRGSPEQTTASSTSDQDLFYVIDPFTGRIVREIPPAVLSDIFAQLKRKGMSKEAEHMRRLYDLGSGRVRDSGRIASAEERIRALGRRQGAGHESHD